MLFIAGYLCLKFDLFDYLNHLGMKKSCTNNKKRKKNCEGENNFSQQCIHLHYFREQALPR